MFGGKSGKNRILFLSALIAAVTIVLCSCSGGPAPEPTVTPPIPVPGSSFADGRGLQVGFKLLYALDGAGGNSVLGTTGLSGVLAAVKDGAAGRTDAALAVALGMQDMLPRQINDVAARMRQTLGKLKQGRVISAWGLFIGEEQYIRQDYINDCSQYFDLAPTFPDIALEAGNFNKYLGEWTDDRTLGRMKDVNFTMPDFSAPFFVDILTVDTDWQMALDTGKSRPLPFKYEGEAERAVPTMVCLQNCGIYDGADGSMAILPTSGDETRLVVMRPPDGTSLRDFIPMAAAGHDGWIEKAEWQTQRVLLPRFSVAFEGSALPVLESAGLAALLEKGGDYGKLGNGLYFSDILHKASLVVDESGVDGPDPEAATYRPNNKDDVRTLAIDRPFIVALEKTDENGNCGQVLMMGIVRDPLHEAD